MTTRTATEAAPVPVDRAAHLARVDRFAVALIAGARHIDYMRPFKLKADGTPFDYAWKVACEADAIARAIERATEPRESVAPTEPPPGENKIAAPVEAAPA